jgi:hypothetical protein
MAMTLTSGHLEGRAMCVRRATAYLRSINTTFNLQIRKFDEDDDTIGLLMLVRLIDEQLRELDETEKELCEMAADLAKKERAEAKKEVPHA